MVNVLLMTPTKCSALAKTNMSTAGTSTCTLAAWILQVTRARVGFKHLGTVKTSADGLTII